MDYLQIVLLALIQGITEFLPISSSAHLILPAEILGWPDQGLAFDVAVHVGSLTAVVIYFRKTIFELIVAWSRSLATRQQTTDSRLAWYIIWATIPAGLCGVLFNDFIEANFRSIAVIMWATIIFGIYLGWTDYRGKKTLPLTSITLVAALIIGSAQALALIPGTSRSGITIAVALALGFQRDAAARFSFLLSIPIIAAGGLFKTLELMESHAIAWTDIFLGALLSGISAYLCIKYFLSFINNIGMMPFVIYRLLLGAVLGAILLFG